MKKLLMFVVQIVLVVWFFNCVNGCQAKNDKVNMDFSKIDMESNVQEGRESDNNIATKSSSYWEKEYNKAKYYYNDYKTNSLLQDMYNMQAEYLVKMSIAAWNLGKKRTAVHHLYNTIDVLENHYGYTSAGAAKMLLKKMEDGTCPKEIPVDIVIGTKTDPITDASICITYGVVTIVMMKANKAQLNQEMEFMRRMRTLGGNTDYVLPIMEIQTPMDASQIRCIARLHYLDITHDIFNPNHRPKGDRKKQMMWDMTKIIYDIFND